MAFTTGNKMKIIDVHAHAYPDGLAAKAMAGLCKANPTATPSTDGTIRGLLSEMNCGGIAQSWILPIATKPHHAGSILKWICSFRSERLLPFGSVHPESENFVQELNDFKQAGIKGIKLHPMYQDFAADDKKAYPLYEEISSLGFVVMFHAGWDVGFPQSRNASADKFSKVLHDFPKMKVILAHCGGWRREHDTLKWLCGKNVWFDTSFIEEIPSEERKKLFNAHGTDKFLFGTDCPWAFSGKCVRFIQYIPEISDEDKEKIFFRNAETLINWN